MAEAPGAGFSAYHAATRDGAPRKTLLAALDAFPPATGFALDLGCGTGRDTVELLRRGWRVLAVDADASAIAELSTRAESVIAGDRLEVRVARFEATALPPVKVKGKAEELKVYRVNGMRHARSITPNPTEWSGPTNA